MEIVNKKEYKSVPTSNLALIADIKRIDEHKFATSCDWSIKIWEYKLTFLDFVNFSLSEECEAKYRLLMKKVKQRTNSDIYLPMTLKQTLEHIFNKGKIKLNIAKINKGINKLEKIEKMTN